MAFFLALLDATIISSTREVLFAGSAPDLQGFPRQGYGLGGGMEKGVELEELVVGGVGCRGAVMV